MERSDKIRTYNFQQDRITDHRIGLTTYGVESFLSGGEALDDVIQKLVAFERQEKLLELFNSVDTEETDYARKRPKAES